MRFGKGGGGSNCLFSETYFGFSPLENDANKLTTRINLYINSWMK